MNWQEIRDQFPALRNWVFLNSATFGQLPRAATEAVAKHFAHRDELACSDFGSWFDEMDALRADCARLINARPEDIAFVPNATTAVSLFMNGIEWREGDEVITLEDEFPNHLYWAQTPPVTHHIVPWKRFYETLNSRTRVVLMSTVNYTTGLRPPERELAGACRKAGALLYLDGTQSVGALRFDCQAVQPAMFALDGYKWLLSPNGAGFMYVHPSTREWLKPSHVGWRSDRNWRDFATLNHGAPEYVASAERFEGGMVPFPPLYGMRASIRMMLEIGLERIEQRVMQLAALTREQLRELGATVLDHDSPIVAARWPGVDSPALVAELKRRRILVAARQGNLRVSTHFYNQESDIACLIEHLKQILANSRSKP